MAEVKSQLEEAKQYNIHRKELSDIEKELMLAQKELDGFFACDNDKDVDESLACDVETDSQDVTDKKDRRKHAELLRDMPFCEIIPSKKTVRSRNGSGTSEPPLKQLKFESIDEMESDDVKNDVTKPSSNRAPVLSASSVPNSILPPMPTLKSPPKDCGDAAVAQVLRRYITDGALKADDLLDEFSIKSDSIDALRFMMELELDPGRSSSAPSYKPTLSNLTNAVLLTARALDLRTKYPLQARELAQKALFFVDDEAIKSRYPKSWIADLESIGKPPLNSRQPLVSSSDKVNNTVDEAWLKVKRNDPKAPKVMSDSILPMIGLGAVKESLLSMYHRLKLSQEQGDGAAASYNVRFECNPGSVLAF